MATIEKLALLAAVFFFGYVLWQWAQQPGAAAGVVGQAARVANQSPTAPAIAPQPVQSVSDSDTYRAAREYWARWKQEKFANDSLGSDRIFTFPYPV